jgi:hypothetical protein
LKQDVKLAKNAAGQNADKETKMKLTIKPTNKDETFLYGNIEVLLDDKQIDWVKSVKVNIIPEELPFVTIEFLPKEIEMQGIENIIKFIGVGKENKTIPENILEVYNPKEFSFAKLKGLKFKENQYYKILDVIILDNEEKISLDILCKDTDDVITKIFTYTFFLHESRNYYIRLSLENCFILIVNFLKRIGDVNEK